MPWGQAQYEAFKKRFAGVDFSGAIEAARQQKAKEDEGKRLGASSILGGSQRAADIGKGRADRRRGGGRASSILAGGTGNANVRRKRLLGG